jgi:hypothetical protein
MIRVVLVDSPVSLADSSFSGLDQAIIDVLHINIASLYYYQS